MIEIETKNLLLRQWCETDFEHFSAYYADEKNARFVGGVLSPGRAWRLMATLAGHWILRGYGPWAVEEKESGLFVGSIGLWFPHGWPELELGYWLVAEMQGKGYATEAGARARVYAFTEVGADTLVSYIDPVNEPSKRVAERLGATYDKTIDLAEFGPHDVYRYTNP